MRIYTVTRKKQVSIALSGTSGTANIIINGQEYLATFDTSLTVTADNFRTTHAADVLSDQGIVVTDDDAGSVVLTADESGEDFTVSVENVTGNLDGSISEAQKQANYEILTSALEGAGGGNICVFQIKNLDTGELVPDAEKIKKINYHEGDLITLADDLNFTLVASDGDGGNAETKHTES